MPRTAVRKVRYGIVPLEPELFLQLGQLSRRVACGPDQVREVRSPQRAAEILLAGGGSADLEDAVALLGGQVCRPGQVVLQSCQRGSEAGARVRVDQEA
jgi:hypothetical protein